jgi:hypothetical protein
VFMGSRICCILLSVRYFSHTEPKVTVKDRTNPTIPVLFT